MKREINTNYQIYLDKLKEEILAYPNEKMLWEKPATIPNSGGNLSYHLLGNLNHYIGAVIGQTGYVRERDKEFAIRNVPVSELISWIEDTQIMIEEVILNIPDLEADYPENGYGKTGTIRYQLFRLLAHLSYHVGQLNYHRRFIPNIAQGTHIY